MITYNLVDKALVDLGISKDTVDGLDGGSEEILAKLLETSSGDGGVEVNTLEERVDLDGGLSRRRESSLGTFASGSETSKSAHIAAQILLVFPFEFQDEVVDKSIVEVLTTQVSVTGGGLDLEDTLLNGKERNIEGTTTKIEDEDVSLTLDLLVETVGDSGSGGLVNDSENVEAGNETSILGGLTLAVVEVGGDSNDGVVDSLAKVGLSGLSHLGQDHGRNLLGGELLGLALELNLDDGLATLLDNLEGEVLHIGLDLSIAELATDQSLGVEDGVCGVHGDLVLGGITDQSLGVGETDEGGSSSVTLVIGNDIASELSVSD